MDIKTMKRAAKAAAREAGTSYQQELNRLAGGAGFTHWGALVAAQPNPSFGYRYNPLDEQNARDLQQARNDRVHVLYVAEDHRIAVSHVIGMANSVVLLPPADMAAERRMIARPTATAVIDDGLMRDWKDMRRIKMDEIANMASGSVVYAEQMRWEYVTAATLAGIILVGAIIPEHAGTWPKEDDPFLTLFIPTQVDTSQQVYSKEDQEVIYATTAVKYVLPRNGSETVSLIEDEVGTTTIRRFSGRSTASRANPGFLTIGDYVRPGDIAKRIKERKG